MRAEHFDLTHAAAEYEAALVSELGDAGNLGLAILGVGPDGHVCSLFPDHPALLSDARVVVITDAPKPPPRRLSLTLPFLTRSKKIWIVAVGDEKRAILRKTICKLSDPQALTPIDLVIQQASSVTVFTDQAIEVG